MINEFLQYIQYEKNYSSHTVLSYHTDLKQFCNFLKTTESDFKYAELTPEDIQFWVLELMNSNISARSLSRKISTLKSFWHFLLSRNYIQHNPTIKIILPKTIKSLPAFFKNKEMEQILDETFLTEDFESLRNHLIIELFYLTGIRLSELINIKDLDIDFGQGSLRVIGKRNKQRIIPLSSEFISKIEKYIVVRNKEIDSRDSFLFVLVNGKKLYPEFVYRHIHNKMSQVSNLSKRSPHVLRHTFATTMLNEGADINAVKELLGHSSLAATQIYTHTSFKELSNIYKQAHPRAK